MPSDNSSTALAGLLRTTLGITNVARQTFPPRWKTRDEVIVTHRYGMLLDGDIHYRCEGVTTLLRAGQQMFAPAWSRRQWWSKGGCRLLWCEFATEHLPLEIGSLLFRKGGDMKLEKAGLERMLKLWPGMHLPYEKTGLARGVPGAPPEELQLVLEGELKASLARFWFETSLVTSKSSLQHNTHPEVRAALAWLDSHYQEPDVLEAFYRWLPLSPNHFRILFKKATGSTVQDYLLRLRQRRARFLVHETGRPLKQIAAEVGYENPLFFSRQYRKFWGHPPSEDRKIA